MASYEAMMRQLLQEADADIRRSSDLAARAQFFLMHGQSHRLWSAFLRGIEKDHKRTEHAAIMAYRQAKDLYEEIGNISGTAYTAYNMANALNDFGDSTLAQEMYREALTKAEQLGDQLLKDRVERALS